MGNPVSFRPPSSGGAEYCENCGWGTTPPPPTPGTPTSQRGPFSLFTTYKARFEIAFSLLGTDGIWESGLFMKTKSPPPKTGAGLRPIAWSVSA
jgi:hypothetical protein